MNSWDKALSACDEIEELLRTATAGANEQRLQRIPFLTAALGGTSPYITDKANALASRAAIYFSARKHATYTGGAEALMREMRYSLLGRIREEAQQLAKNG